MLTFRRIRNREKSYAVQLARKEINIMVNRLDQYKTYLIYNDRERIGFVSFGFRNDQTIYMYVLAFEKHAQRKGFSSVVFDWTAEYGQKNYPHFKGLTATVHKLNLPAIKAVKKYGFVVVRERKNYYDFFKLTL